MKAVGLILVALPYAALAEGINSAPRFEHDYMILDSYMISDCVKRAGGARRLKVDFTQVALGRCVGAAAGQCIEEFGYDRRTMIGCAGLERSYWKWRLDVVVSGLSGQRSSNENPQQFPYDNEKLFDTLAAWEVFRDARCDYATITYGEGALQGREAGIASEGCKMNQTALFALDLEQRLRSNCESQNSDRYGEACEFREQ